MNRKRKSNPTASEFFAKRRETGRPLLIGIALTTTIHAAAYWHLAGKISTKQSVLVMDAQTYFLPKALDFAEAKDLHVSQASLLLESLMDRGPTGVDHPERLKRLCERTAYQEALSLIQKDAVAFEAKKLHQKVEIRGIQILQAEDDTVMVAVDAQLIRSGEFGEGPFQEALSVTGRLHFVRNPAMLQNGAFPTLLRSMNLEINPVP